jgi:hypothetical protein
LTQSSGPLTPQERYQDLIDELSGEQLVLKLPRSRVDELVGAGHGARFDANKGTPMKEWFALAPDSALPWLALASEALAFARTSVPR